MKCVILAAGAGSRLSARHKIKPLCPVSGKPLIEWVILAARAAGIREFVIVTGHARAELEARVRDIALLHDVSVSFARNDEWKKGNGLSVYAARHSVGDTFVLLMCDHLFDATILSALIAQPIAPGEIVLAVDLAVPEHPTVDLEDVTMVQQEKGFIAAIGKGLPRYNAFDTGIFLCTPGLFEALEESARGGDDSLSGGVRVLAGRRQARTVDIGGKYWIDVDDERALDKAGAVAQP